MPITETSSELTITKEKRHFAEKLSSNENSNELEYEMKIKHEVMLFTLETQSNKKLSLNGVLLITE